MHKKKVKSSEINKPAKKRLYNTNKYNNSPPHPLINNMTLQNTIGNQEIQRLCKTYDIMTKLFISQPGDRFEQQADKIANQIVYMKKPSHTPQDISVSDIIQAKFKARDEFFSSGRESEFSQLKGNGHPLDKSIKDYMQPRFGADFQDVRIHTNSNADKLARGIRARAFTYGNNIVFAKGEYTPQSQSGKKLLAHELTHIMQQRKTEAIQKKDEETGTSSIKAYIVGIGSIKSYSGEFPSPLKLMWYVPETNELLKVWFPPSEIRSWIKSAAEYHGIPHELIALILQQENGPKATDIQKILQFGERTLTTFSAILDDTLWDIIPDNISGGSSGFANMSRATLRDAAEYTERVYDKNPLPDDVRYRVLNWDQDTRIPGDDWKADLYYCAAHIRQLIDRVKGTPRYNGPLTIEDVRQVCYSYNGSGSLAEKYANDAINLLTAAAAGSAELYFYEK